MENKQAVTRVLHAYKINATSKEVRKLAYDIGYGATTGVLSALFIVHLGLGFVKAVKHRMDIKAEAENKKEQEEEKAEK